MNAQADAQGHKRGRVGVATLFYTIPIPCKRPHSARDHAGNQYRPPHQHLEEYDNKTRLIPIDRNQIDFNILSRQEYEDVQVAGLLNMKLSEVKEMRNPTPKETTEPT